MRKFFNYIKSLWEGEDGKPALKAVLALAFSVDFIRNLSHAIFKWDAGRTLEGLSLVLGIEAGLITAMAGITAWSNMTAKKIDADSTSSQISTSTTTIQKADIVTTDQTKKPAEPVDAK